MLFEVQHDQKRLRFVLDLTKKLKLKNIIIRKKIKDIITKC